MERIMVCVTKQITCDRLITFGNGIRQDGDTLNIIHVSKTDYNFLGDEQEGRALNYLYEKSREVGAELTVIRANDVIDTLSQIVTDKDITKVIIGEGPMEKGTESFIDKLKASIDTDVDLCVVPSKE